MGSFGFAGLWNDTDMSKREEKGTEISKTKQWTLQIHAKIFTTQQKMRIVKTWSVFLKAKLFQFKCLSLEIRSFYILNAIKSFLLWNTVIIHSNCWFLFLKPLFGKIKLTKAMLSSQILLCLVTLRARGYGAVRIGKKKKKEEKRLSINWLFFNRLLIF